MSFRDWFRSVPEAETRVAFDENGLSVIRQADSISEVTEIRWRDVQWVASYKLDCFVHDSICVAVSDGDRTVVVVEADAGFSELVPALGSCLQGLMEDWYQRQVSAPAFETNFHVIYRRSEQAADLSTASVNSADSGRD